MTGETTPTEANLREMLRLSEKYVEKCEARLAAQQAVIDAKDATIEQREIGYRQQLARADALERALRAILEADPSLAPVFDAVSPEVRA